MSKFLIHEDDYVNDIVIKEKLEEISLDQLVDCANHTYKVIENDEMQQLAESIKSIGVMEPILVRRIDDKYEILSGHRRVYASRLAGCTTIKAIVKNLSDPESIIHMADGNLQRENITTSEKARTYKAKFDALKSLGQKWGKNTLESISENAPDNLKTIQRLIKIANLSDELLFLVDSNRITSGAAYTLGFIENDVAQKSIYDAIIELDIKKVDDAKAKILREKYEDGTFGPTTAMDALINRPVSPKKKPLKLSEKVYKYFPGTDDKDIEDKILEILDKYFSEDKE